MTLISAAREYEIEFIYAISPGLDITFSNPKEVSTLKRKLDQVTSLLFHYSSLSWHWNFLSYFYDVKRKPNSYFLFLYIFFTLMLLIEEYFLKWATGGTSAFQSSLCIRTALKECLEVMLKRMLTNNLHSQRLLYWHEVGAYLRN